MFKKILSAFLACFVLILSFSSCAKKTTDAYDITPLLEEVGANTKIAYVVRKDYKMPVFTRDQNRSTRPGALNHIMIALLTLEKTPDPINTTVSPNDETFVGIGGAMLPNIDMVSGETYTVQDLLYAMLLGNSYDAANLLAQYVGGDAGIPGCIELMNTKVKEITQTDGTTFVDPNGLTATNQYTTAYDFYMITDYILTTQPTFIGYFSSQEYVIPKRVNQREFTVTNYNPFTSSGSPDAYQGAVGIGYTSYSDDLGQHSNLISLVNIDGFEYIVVLLDAPSSTTDSAAAPVYDPNPSSDTSSATVSSAATTSSNSTSSTSSDATVSSESAPVPEASNNNSFVFNDAKEIASWIQNYVQWIGYPSDGRTLYTVHMDSSKEFPNMTIPVGIEKNTLATSSDNAASSYVILCIGPKTFIDPIQKNQAVGQATIINLTDGTSTTENIVALDSTQPSTILQLFLMLLRIIVILATIFLILVIIIRIRNIQMRKKALEAKRNHARKAAIEGHTVGPYATSSTKSTQNNRTTPGNRKKKSTTKRSVSANPNRKRNLSSNSSTYKRKK